MNKQNGFNLIELMIVVTIIGILAAIAVPSYQKYVIKGNRAAAQSFIMDIASREKQYLLDARSYIPNWAITDPAPNLAMRAPNEVSKFYTITISVPGTIPPTFTITATPESGSMQASDGNLTLDDTGAKTGKW